MVGKVPKKLIKWWGTFNYVEQQGLAKKLGTLTSLLDITPRPDLIEAISTFWDPSCLVFRFGNFEMTPTLADVSGFFKLPCIKKIMIWARTYSPTRFLHGYGLKSNKHLTCLNQSWVFFDYLYSRFEPSDGFDCFWDEFYTTKENWEKRCLEVFALALLGILVFPLEERRVNTHFQTVVMALFHKNLGETFTLVPMILAEIYKGLTEVKGGIRFLEGSNLILQLWMMEHLHEPSLIRLDVIDRCMPEQVNAMNQRMHFDKFSLPIGINA
ncbi:uncharacterized protein LOC107843862 [Capsicum annuum]|uniref:uncharacterized protein LOC107843862 n=1 Tax=Capsicum annuum TaxID=4072 RepID=UPI001FB0EA45|nr:uncharacterized protein LOC107843862 [Capsicum annuum]